jgi:hypothetical protein
VSERHWVIVEAASGVVLQRQFITEGCHPRSAGWAWDPETQVAHQVPADRLAGYTAGEVEWIDGAFVDNLAPLTAQLLARIDAETGEFRKRFITVGPGQEMTYVHKGNEAKAFLADPNPDPANYPMLKAEADATERPIAALAADVAQAALFWTLLGSASEAARIGAKRAVEAAATAAGKKAAAVIDWVAVETGVMVRIMSGAGGG